MGKQIIYIFYSKTFSSKEDKAKFQENFKNLLLARVVDKNNYEIFFYKPFDIPSVKNGEEIEKFFNKKNPHKILLHEINATVFNEKILFIKYLFFKTSFFYTKRDKCENIISFALEIKNISKLVIL